MYIVDSSLFGLLRHYIIPVFRMYYRSFCFNRGSSSSVWC